ncbi:DUF3320 domain-containing protein [Nocardia sp. NPDC058658]|uniref:DUF3320 domain-containing protein n=1 Tax=Nocardia sp. NPDC058658 TaxID=3346580 RepID=UPI00364EE7BF
MDQVQWFGRIGWVVGLIAGVFGVLLGAVGYFSGIGNASTPEIVLAVGFLVAGTALASVSIWQLVASDRHKRRTFTRSKQRRDPDRGYGQPPNPGAPQHGYGTHPGVPHQSYGPPAPSHPQLPNPTPPTPYPQAAYTPPSAPIAPTVAQTPEWQTRTRTAHHWLPTGIPYAGAPTGVLGSPADLDRDSSATIPLRIREAVRETIAIEGPIERNQLVARVAQRFGVHKPSEKQQICVLGEVPESLMRATSSGVFVWPSDLDPAAWRGFRFTPPTVSRAIDTISAEEIVNAITHVAQRNRSTFDEIVWATLTQFGHERTGAAEDRLEACLTMAVRRGRLARDPDGRYRALT